MAFYYICANKTDIYYGKFLGFGKGSLLGTCL